MKKLLLFIPLVLFLVMGVFLYRGLYLNPQQLDSALEGKAVPDFNLSKLEDPKVMITNHDLKGQVYIMNVWATWCPSCKYEHPYLVHLSRQNIVPIYGINYRDQRGLAVEELNREGDPYTMNIFDPDGKLGLDLGVYGAPESFIVDHNGIIRFRYAGPVDMRVWNETIYPIVKKLQQEATTAQQETTKEGKAS
ncbi:DsbE family thiol:disulfide interchange protein [Shewanella yunxiaonensis]|uniref:DsbE family thiol:disulfide interchange protein n=1 Tax=Shewanella yunxiaonensis TaxID=2829809 RepID=A0ABX7YSF9_9GAMM|nr:MULTISPECIES: DsbE family thiol:disulfide interchange protein [Shewanella]MDF0536020.1 DsbE family thiol:disulfide interchange protein [Shewanella sp. A32]QUN05687.1 DsbE family thiol:disulfide interchange protein [Shewanella yunxiaonensis]